MPFAKNGTVSTDSMDGGIQITLQEYHDAIDAIASGKLIIVSGERMEIANSEAVTSQNESPTLEDLRSSALAQIDALAESARLRYMTGGAGQALTYQKKAAEAKSYLSTSNPNATDYPMLSAEVGLTSDTLLGVAQIVAAKDAAWGLVGGDIERIRLGAKTAIRAAVSVEAINAALSVAWP